MNRKFIPPVSNSYAFPFKRSGEYLNNQIVAYDAACGAFTNQDLDRVLCGRTGGDCRPDIIFSFNTLGNGTQNTFVMPFVAGIIDTILVTIDGVLQSFNQYTLQRFEQVTNISFWNTPVLGSKIEVLYYELQPPREVFNFVGNGTGAQTSVTIPFAVTSKDSLLVFVNGQKTNGYTLTYSNAALSNTVLTFDNNLSTLDEYRIFSLFGFSPLDFTNDVFISNGSNSNYILPFVVNTNVQLFVTVNGFKLPITDYELSSLGTGETQISLLNVPPLNAVVEVIGLFGLSECPGQQTVSISGVNLGLGYGIFNTATDDGNGNVTLTFKTLVAGNNIAITDTGDTLVISTTIAPGDAQSFTDLEDTPDSYAGSGGKFVRVKPDESGLDFSNSSGSVDWEDIQNTPTTLAGYGITDAYQTVLSRTSSDIAPLTVGTPVYVKPDGTIARTDSNNISVSLFFGMVYDATILPGATGFVQIAGTVANTIVIWDDTVQSGSPFGLTQGSKYYLAPGGKITSNPPTTGYSRQVGIATSTTELKLEPQNTVRLS